MEVLDNKGNILKAGGVVINSEGKILVYKNKDRGFSFPKGHVDPGESFEQAAKREVSEETGLKTEILKELPNIAYLNSNNNKNVLIKMFLMNYFDGEFVIEEKGDELRWVDFDTAVELLKPNSKHSYRDFSKYLVENRELIPKDLECLK